MFLRKVVLKIWSKFTGEHSCWNVISIKLQNNFIEITLRHECSPVNLLHVFRTPCVKNTSGRLLLIILRIMLRLKLSNLVRAWVRLISHSPLRLRISFVKGDLFFSDNLLYGVRLFLTQNLIKTVLCCSCDWSLFWIVCSEQWNQNLLTMSAILSLVILLIKNNLSLKFSDQKSLTRGKN